MKRLFLVACLGSVINMSSVNSEAIHATVASPSPSGFSEAQRKSDIRVDPRIELLSVVQLLSGYAPISQQMKEQAYPDWEYTVNEHIIRALTSRFASREIGKEAGDRELQKDKNRRSIYVEALAERLKSAYLAAFAQNPKPREQDKPFVVEYYYKAKWGYAEEFIRLFKKNHYPLLKKQMVEGRILQLKAETPFYHVTEDGRWDYRVTITWKNSVVAHDDYDESVNAKKLFPDQETFKREEQRRFEILLGHWDTPVVPVDLDKP